MISWQRLQVYSINTANPEPFSQILSCLIYLGERSFNQLFCDFKLDAYIRTRSLNSCGLDGGCPCRGTQVFYLARVML